MKQLDDAIPTRRTFEGEWDEIGYLYDKLLYWFYGKGSRHKARPFCERLKPLLRRADAEHEAVFGEECWSLVCELDGDLENAIAYREHEIELIRRLWKVSIGTAGEEFVLKRYGPDDLCDRLDLLAMLYHDVGNLEKALMVLLESKQLCRQHGIRFYGADLLRDYRAERAEAVASAAG